MAVRPIAPLAALACAFGAGCDGSEAPRARAGSAFVQSLQAEDAAFSRAHVETLNAGYTGDGYVNTDNVAGSWVEWRVVGSARIPAKLAFRYALGGDERTATLRVNGAVVESNLSFPNTGSWNTWHLKMAGVSLVARTNTVRLVCASDAGCPNLDRLDVTREARRIAVDGFFVARRR